MRTKIEHRVGIQTPAEVIWQVIADIQNWSAWNPIYPKAEGTLRIGAPLTLELALEGRKPQVIKPVILDWIPNEQIHWRLSLFCGLVKTTRYFEIEKLGEETGCVFSNGEMFDGLLGPTAAKSIRREVKRGFTAMGEAVKARAEAAWRNGAGITT
jgi:hypothetical protein